MFVVVVSVGAVATLLFTGLYGSRIFFDPHRPYQKSVKFPLIRLPLLTGHPSICAQTGWVLRPFCAQVFLALLLFAGVASAQELPETPKPKHDRKVFIAGTALLAASKTADAVISGQLLNCGGVEQNPLFGPHPSPAKQAGVNAGIFAGEVLAFHFTERNRHAWVRWLGRAAVGLESEEHIRAFAHNAELHTIRTSQGCRVVP